MLKGTISFEGKTFDDAVLAIEEALKRIKDGNIVGFDRNEDGNFSFEVAGEEDEPKRETKVIVAGVNANGESDFYFVKVLCTQEQINNCEHYDAAKKKAEEEGYDPKIAYDSADPGGSTIINCFVWDSASTIEIEE